MTNTLNHNLVRQPLTWVLTANVLALAAFAASGHAAEFPFAMLGIQAFILVQIFLPSCRPALTTPLCPANFAQAFFWVQLALVPVLMGLYGVSQGTLPRLPSSEAINWASGLRVLAYVSFCIAYHYFSKQLRRDEHARQRAHVSDDAQGAPYYLVMPFLAIGFVGFFLAYGSIDGYIDYISSPLQQKEREQEATTMAGAASTFLRPFLGFALVLAWSAWLSRRPRGAIVGAGVTAMLIAALLLANFSYNRGALLAPLLAVSAAYSTQVRRVSLVAIAAAGPIVLFAALAFGWYRSTDQQITELSAADIQETWSGSQLVDFVQIYASGPQMTAFLIEELDAANPLYLGKTLVPSLLHTVPILGKPFRPDSGVTIFNMMIYGDPEIADQIISYDAELYMNFHVPGVVLGYAMLGGLVAFFQRRFVRAENGVESYFWFLVALWMVFPGSLPVASQICVYFFWPVYIYLIVKARGPTSRLAKGWAAP